MSFIRYPTVSQRMEHGFRVSVPDFPGVAATGMSLGEAMSAAQAALAGRIAAMVEDDLQIPEPTWMSVIEDDPRFAGFIFGLIMADVSLWRPAVVN